jgi:hypothetical protein
VKWLRRRKPPPLPRLFCGYDGCTPDTPCVTCQVTLMLIAYRRMT